MGARYQIYESSEDYVFNHTPLVWKVIRTASDGLLLAGTISHHATMEDATEEAIRLNKEEVTDD